jgi:hypothetical protein
LQFLAVNTIIQPGNKDLQTQAEDLQEAIAQNVPIRLYETTNGKLDVWTIGRILKSKGIVRKRQRIPGKGLHYVYHGIAFKPEYLCKETTQKQNTPLGTEIKFQGDNSKDETDSKSPEARHKDIHGILLKSNEHQAYRRMEQLASSYSKKLVWTEGGFRYQ